MEGNFSYNQHNYTMLVTAYTALKLTSDHVLVGTKTAPGKTAPARPALRNKAATTTAPTTGRPASKPKASKSPVSNESKPPQAKVGKISSHQTSVAHK